MTTGFNVNGYGDLSTIFNPRTSGTAPTTNYRVNGTDLNQLLQVSATVGSAGSDQINYNTNYDISYNGVPTDLRFIFQKINFIPFTTTSNNMQNSGSSYVIQFTSNGSITFNVSGITLNYLLVGAGGSGGAVPNTNVLPGGGGGGIFKSSITTAVTTYNFSIATNSSQNTTALNIYDVGGQIYAGSGNSSGNGGVTSAGGTTGASGGTPYNANGGTTTEVTINSGTLSYTYSIGNGGGSGGIYTGPSTYAGSGGDGGGSGGLNVAGFSVTYGGGGGGGGVGGAPGGNATASTNGNGGNGGFNSTLGTNKLSFGNGGGAGGTNSILSSPGSNGTGSQGVAVVWFTI